MVLILISFMNVVYFQGAVAWSVSYPEILVKSNSDELQTSLKSSPELCSNKSLCQGSAYALFH